MKHYRVVLKTSNLPYSREEIRNFATKYFNLDDEPKIVYNSSRNIDISLRLRYDSPSKRVITRPCEIINDVISLVRDMGIAWKYIEIMETETFEGATGSALAKEVGGSSVSDKDVGGAIVLAALGGLLGYMIGSKGEIVKKILCVYQNKHGFPILVSSHE
ncbi:hypothetical protein L3N51_01386 [Metallosphaera sp. J1]|uniref:hypothetical protein n=1 Tax=Metallosphaera javensis (ex Hofmann et al. 2022) TaxID=99938 RepID=UPI001EDCC290|nr:hypothetical protein [Metallosphaera javensis (ex Hofmann et al. 2022)]MCG3109096.1 hypothetical protein [Metallosphaera javensis (ex Hofmann et al. 2022)]